MTYIGIGIVIYLVNIIDSNNYKEGTIQWVWQTLDWMNVLLWGIAPIYWICYKILEYFTK